MNHSSLFILCGIILVSLYWLGKQRARKIQATSAPRLALPRYYGTYLALWAGLPALGVMLIWLLAENALVRHLLVWQLPEQIQLAGEQSVQLALQKTYGLAAHSSLGNDPSLQPAVDYLLRWKGLSQWVYSGLVLSLMLLSAAIGWHFITPKLHARVRVEKVSLGFLWLSSAIALLTTLGILISVVHEAWLFFRQVPVFDFLFGTLWSPQISLRPDQTGSSGSFGAVPLFAGTLLISFIAMLVAVPIGLMTAVYLSEYASKTMRSWIKPTLEILAGIPTVVYGFFAALTVAPLVRTFGESLGLSVSSESALAAGLVMGVMIIPFVSSLSDDVINAVPQSLRDGSYGLGATRSETVKKVVLPAALPGIVAAIMLAVSRAIGETMIVAMAAGLAANLTANPFASVTTVTVQIVTLLVGDQEFDSAKTLAAFALGLVLFVLTLGLNFVALKVVQKYREHYE